MTPKQLLLLGLSILLTLHTATTNAESKPLKLGVLLSLSGGLEQWCNYYRQGFELAAAEEGQSTVQLLYEDDHSVDQKAALTAAKKLVEVDHVDVLFNWTASTVSVIAPLSEHAKVPFVIGCYDQTIAQAGKYILGSTMNYDTLSRSIASFLVTKLKSERIALVMADDRWALNFEKPFTEEVVRRGGAIVTSETVRANELDFKPLILRMKAAGVTAVLSPLYGSSLYAFLRAARELRFAAKIHVADGMFEEDLKTADQDAEGVYASQFWIDSPAFVAKYGEQFHREASPLQLGLVAAAYDIARHILGAAKGSYSSDGALNPDALLRELQSFRSEGLLGSFMLGAPPSGSPLTQVVVREGRYVKAE